VAGREGSDERQDGVPAEMVFHRAGIYYVWARMSDPSRPPRTWTPFVATAGAVALLMALGYAAGIFRPSTTLADLKAQNRAAAVRIRESAERVCEQGRNLECLRMYEEAKRFDPEGDVDPEVVEARRRAHEGLGSDASPSATRP
jgi:hypothetical protein